MDLLTALHEARTQWRNLESVYNQVTDPAVVDSIIHQMVVAEQTYDRLLARAREEHLLASEIQLRK